MKARYPWVAVWADTARVGAVAAESYSGVAQGIVRRNLPCFAHNAREDLRRDSDFYRQPSPSRLDIDEMARA